MPIESNILFGKVVSLEDPEKLGRIQVELMGFSKVWKTQWLRVLQTTASKTGGHFFLPEVGSEVSVLRGFGNHVQGMLVMGSLYGPEAKPKPTDPPKDNNIKQLLTRSGHELTFDDTKDKEKVLLQTGDKAQSIAFDMKEGTLTITGKTEIKVVCKDKAIVIEAKDVDVKATGNVTVSAKGDVVVKDCAKASVTAKDSVTVKGTNSVTVDGGKSLKLTAKKVAIG